MRKPLLHLAVRIKSLRNATRRPARQRNLQDHVACRSFDYIGVLLVSLMTTACTTTVRLENNFPSPAVDALPLRAAVVYDKEFKDYTYAAPRDADPVRVELGPAQVRLLDQTLGGLFYELSQITTPPTGDSEAQADVVIVPTVERFTLNSPAYHGNDYYEVHIAYRLDLYSPTGRFVGGLPLEGHARAPARWTSLSAPVHQVTVRALRDAAVRIILELPEQPAIQQLLESATKPNNGRHETP